MNDQARNPQTPNVLLICCDHLRADWLGCNGHPLVQTPQIDKLSYGGVNFRQAFSECPVCVPARRILFTGQGPHQIHMQDNRDFQPFTEGPKLAQLMTSAGYQTYASGKLHTCPQRNRIGFEDVALNEEGRKQDSPQFVDDYEAFVNDSGFAHLAYTHGMGNNQYGVRLSPLPEPLTTTHWTAQQAMRFIERRDPTRPFFLYVSFDKPHPPITPPAEYYELYRETHFPEPVWGEWTGGKTPAKFKAARAHQSAGPDGRLPETVVQHSLRGFAAMITHIDSMLGALLGTLREAGVLDNTHVLLTSDHGDALFEHGNFAKSDFFRGSTNVPWIVRPAPNWAAAHGFRADRIDETRPVGLADIMPTLLELCGLSVPDRVTGQSLVSALLDPGAAFRPFSFGACSGCFAISDGRHKYLWFAADDMAFLFDTLTDPLELHDLADEPSHATLAADLRSRLAGWLGEHGDPHAQDGALQPIAPAVVGALRGTNPWNNRGRH